MTASRRASASATARPPALPRTRATFEDRFATWAGFTFRAPASVDAPPAVDGTVRVGWEYESDEAPSPAQRAAYAALKKNEARITDAILRAILAEHPYDASDAEELRAALGTPAIYLLEEEQRGTAYLGFMFPCAWGARHVLGVVTHGARVLRLGHDGSLEVPRRPALGAARDPRALLAQAQELLEQNRHLEAEARLRAALALEPELAPARRQLSAALIAQGRFDEALAPLRAEAHEHPADPRAHEELIQPAMLAGNLEEAATHAARATELRRATRWYPVRLDADPPTPPLAPAAQVLTPAKLQHDIDQLRYLQGRGVLGPELTPVVESYERVLEGLRPLGPAARVPMDDRARAAIGAVYNRLVYVRPTPRVARALSREWDPVAAEDAYLQARPNVLVLDGFLGGEAVESLRRFCLESTIWSTNRYELGRLGTFFRDGFNCPLLIQIGEELRAALPRVIGTRHPLRQVWGFKYASTQPILAAHADFAAVNVNFWITPEEANLDPDTGGLHLYDVMAPRDWDFDSYNRRGDKVHELLALHGARPTHIPYRYNRAVIFDSDLFHATPAITFKPDYESRRINVTLLFGDRLKDG